MESLANGELWHSDNQPADCLNKIYVYIEKVAWSYSWGCAYHIQEPGNLIKNMPADSVNKISLYIEIVAWSYSLGCAYHIQEPENVIKNMPADNLN